MSYTTKILLLIFLFIIPLHVDVLMAQDLYDYSSATDEGDFYNPTEYMGEDYSGEDNSTAENTSVEMDVTEEYYPDGYYEPYDFNYIPSNPVIENEEEPVENNYNSQNYDQDTYIPEAKQPTYEEPLQAEIDETPTLIDETKIIESTDHSLLDEDKKPIRFLIGNKNPKRFIVANLKLNKALKKALQTSTDKEWYELNNEIIKLYSDLNSTEPSYPEIYEEFERINSVLIQFSFSGAFGATDGAIIKWKERYYAIVGPLSTKIKIRKVKREQLIAELTEVLGGKIRKKLSDGTYYVSLGTLTDSLKLILNEVESGNYKKLETLSQSVKIAGKRMKKMLGPYMNLLKAKINLKSKKDEKYRKALEILTI